MWSDARRLPGCWQPCIKEARIIKDIARLHKDLAKAEKKLNQVQGDGDSAGRKRFEQEARYGLIKASAETLHTDPYSFIDNLFRQYEELSEKDKIRLFAGVGLNWKPGNSIYNFRKYLNKVNDLSIDFNVGIDNSYSLYFDLIVQSIGLNDLSKASPATMSLGYLAYVQVLAKIYNELRAKQLEWPMRGGLVITRKHPFWRVDKWQGPLDAARVFVDATTLKMSAMPMVKDETTGEYSFTDMKKAREIVITPAQILEDLPADLLSSLFGDLPVLGDIVGKLKDSSVLRGHKYGAVPIPRAQQVVFMADARENEDPNKVYALYRGREGDKIEVDGKNTEHPEWFLFGYQYVRGQDGIWEKRVRFAVPPFLYT